MVLNPCFFTRGPHNISPGVRGKAGFTHDSGKFDPDVRGKRFSAHVAENLTGEKTKKTGRALRPTCFHQITVGKLAVQPFAAIGINFILQDTEVQDLFVSDLAFVLPFPFPQERIESSGNVCSKYGTGLENE